MNDPGLASSLLPERTGKPTMRHFLLTVVTVLLVSPVVVHAGGDTGPRRPNIIFIMADDKYGQGIVNREFLSENKVFYHQSVESALAAI